jgi:hypothetical protein
LLFRGGGYRMIAGTISKHLGVDVGHPSAFDACISIGPIAPCVPCFVPLRIGFLRQRNPKADVTAWPGDSAVKANSGLWGRPLHKKSIVTSPNVLSASISALGAPSRPVVEAPGLLVGHGRHQGQRQRRSVPGQCAGG